MVGPDSERRPGQGPEAEQKPRWMPIQEMIPKGSIGFVLVSQIPDLGVRLRPETTFNQPLTSLWTSKKAKDLRELQDQGMTRIGDVLRLTNDKFFSLNNAGEVEKRLSKYLDSLFLTPHARLMKAIFISPQYPVPADREQEIIKPVEEAVATLGEGRDKEAITWRFGLRDGVSRTLEEAGQMFTHPVSKGRVRQVEVRALRRLRHPSQSKGLHGLLSLPEESFGRQLFGAVLAKDLPTMRGEVQLSPSAVEEIEPYMGIYFNWAKDLVSLDLKKHPLSRATRSEVESELKRIVQETPLEELPSEGEVFTQPANNLLPEIPLTEEQFEAVSKIPVRELGITVRTYNALMRTLASRWAELEVTVGDILKLSRDELSKIRNFGLGSATDLGDQLEELLGLPEGQYPKGFVKNLLTSSFGPHLRQSEYMQEQWEIHNKKEIDSIRQLTASAMSEGLSLPEEIQKWIIEQYEEGKRASRNIAGVNMRSWKLLAMIEYILNHPEEPGEEKAGN